MLSIQGENHRRNAIEIIFAFKSKLKVKFGEIETNQ